MSQDQSSEVVSACDTYRTVSDIVLHSTVSGSVIWSAVMCPITPQEPASCKLMLIQKEAIAYCFWHPSLTAAGLAVSAVPNGACSRFSQRIAFLALGLFTVKLNLAMWWHQSGQVIFSHVIVVMIVSECVWPLCSYWTWYSPERMFLKAHVFHVDVSPFALKGMLCLCCDSGQGSICLPWEARLKWLRHSCLQLARMQLASTEWCQCWRGPQKALLYPESQSGSPLSQPASAAAMPWVDSSPDLIWNRYGCSFHSLGLSRHIRPGAFERVERVRSMGQTESNQNKIN